MLTRLAIHALRGIPSLELDDLGRVNIFLGTNGAGKTTVLEALWLMGQPTHPGHLINLGNWREMSPPALNSDQSLRSLFHLGNVTNSPTIHFAHDGMAESLTIDAITEENDGLANPASELTAVSDSLEMYAWKNLSGVKVTFRDSNQNEISSTMRLHSNGFQADAPAKKHAGLGTFFIHARRSTSIGETASLLTSMTRTKTTGAFNNAMKTIDPRVIALHPGATGTTPLVYVDIGEMEMLPINVMGDGFCRVALMVTGLHYATPQMLVVDEIDSGLHWSVMERFWKMLLQSASNKQIFCSTHNEEMLAKTLPAFAEDPDALRIFRLDRLSDGQIIAKKYNYDRYKLAVETGVEIR